MLLIQSIQSLAATMSNTLDAFGANDVPAAGPNFKARSDHFNMKLSPSRSHPWGCCVLEMQQQYFFTVHVECEFFLFSTHITKYLIFVLSFFFFHRCYVTWTTFLSMFYLQCRVTVTRFTRVQTYIVKYMHIWPVPALWYWLILNQEE